MTEYLDLSLRLDKLKRQLLRVGMSDADQSALLADTFTREANAIRELAAVTNLEWVSDRLQDVAYECGLAQFDSSVLRLVRAGVMGIEELFADECSAMNEPYGDPELLSA